MKKKVLSLLLCLITLLGCLPFAVLAEEGPVIVEQPQDCYVSVGDRISTTVVAEGENLRYQWYYRNKGSSKFKKSSITRDTYATTMDKKKDGRSVYCLVTDENGNSVKSNTVTMRIPRPKIVQQPENCTVSIGERISITVAAEGENLRYQWYYRNKGGSKFKKSSITGDTYHTTMSKSKDGRSVYCLVTNGDGYSVKSNAVTIKAPRPKIVQQPENCYVQSGEVFSTTVVAEGEGLTYQWYYRNKGSSKFKKSSFTTDTYSTTMTSSRNGRSVYCLVTNADGYSVKSKTVTLKIPKYATITKQPKSVRAAFGKKATVTIKATGDGLKYQWYNRNVGAEEFSASSVDDATYSVNMTEKRSGRSIYCVITDCYGNSVQSDTVRILATGSFKASQYNIKKDAQKDLLKQLKFTVNEPLVWESSNPEVATVDENGLVTGIKNGKATITVVGEITGVKAKCTIQVGKLKQIALTFDDGPSTHTVRLLDHLEDTNAKVTFFMVGDRMNANKKSIQRMAEQGHELGYHSYSHQTQTDMKSSTITAEFEAANKMVKKISGQEFTVWRTPGGAYNDRVLKAVPLPHIMWSVDTLDWKYRNSTTVYNSIVNNAKDGAIILLHDLHGTTVDGAIKAIDKLLDQGYELVTVTQLLSRDGNAPKNSTTYFKGK